MKIRGNTVGTPIKPKKVLAKWLNLTEEEKAQARANIGIDELEDPNRHAKYFTITDDGVVSLKPEYRGACPSNRESAFPMAVSKNGAGKNGDQNKELPEHLVIPEIVNETAVLSLAPGMFLFNHAVVNITLPDIVTEIPDRFCENAWNLRLVNNTERIVKVGVGAFQKSCIEKAVFPNLTTLEANPFMFCSFLVYADIGKVTSISAFAFYYCVRLSRLKGCAEVTSIGNLAFAKTYRLYDVDSFENVTSIGHDAFMRSRLQYDWQHLKNNGCTFGEQATRLQMNPEPFWSDCVYEPCENDVPTLFSQFGWYDDDGKLRKINDTVFETGDHKEMTYHWHGCAWMSIMHAYCALNKLTLTHVSEFEAICDEKDPSIRQNFDRSTSNARDILDALGLNATILGISDATAETGLNRIYETLKNGGYVLAMLGKSSGASGEEIKAHKAYEFGWHTAMVYGVNTKGELLYADSANQGDYEMGIISPIKYPMFLQNSIDILKEAHAFILVSKPAE